MKKRRTQPVWCKRCVRGVEVGNLELHANDHYWHSMRRESDCILCSRESGAQIRHQLIDMMPVHYMPDTRRELEFATRGKSSRSLRCSDRTRPLEIHSTHEERRTSILVQIGRSATSRSVWKKMARRTTISEGFRTPFDTKLKSRSFYPFLCCSFLIQTVRVSQSECECLHRDDMLSNSEGQETS